MADKQERHTFTVDVETENPLALVQSRLRDLDLNSGLTRVKVKVESREPIEIQTDADTESDGVVSQPEPESEPDEAETEDAPAEPAPDDDVPDEDITKFRSGSDAFEIAKTLYDRRDEGLLELDEVRQFTPNDVGIPDQRVSPILWDLSNRGLVEKQKPEHGGKQHRYRLTDSGVASVEASTDS